MKLKNQGRWIHAKSLLEKHFTSFQYLDQFLSLLISFSLSYVKQEEMTHASKIASRYQDDIFNQGIPGSSRPSSGKIGCRVASPVPSPPPINPALLSTSTFPASAMLYAAAAAGKTDRLTYRNTIKQIENANRQTDTYECKFKDIMLTQ